MSDEFEVLLVVSTRGVRDPGWWIFKRLEDQPGAIGVVDGPFPTAAEAIHEQRAMWDRRRALDRATTR